MNKKIVLVVVVLVVLGSYFFMAKGQSDNCVVGPQEVSALKSNSEIVVLDVRTPQEYASGHVEGAILIDVTKPTFSKEIEKLDRDKKYYVYCRTGGRSAHAQKIMKGEGFKDVCNVGGGVVNLQRQGVRLVK